MKAKIREGGIIPSDSKRKGKEREKLLDLLLNSEIVTSGKELNKDFPRKKCRKSNRNLRN